MFPVLLASNLPVTFDARRTCLLGSTLSVLLALLLGCASRDRSAQKPFRAGAFAIDVTPERFPISSNGSMSDRTATQARDPLHARCLVLEDGDARLAIAVVDSCMIPRDLLDDAKAQASKLTGIPVDRMLVSATHAHSAPTVTGVFQSEPDTDYRRFLARRIAEGIKEANDRLAPAQAGWAVGNEPGQVFNRRWLLKEGTLFEDPFGRKRDQVKMNPGYGNKDVAKPAGPVDPQVSVLSVRATDGTPIALLANYSLHYVGGVPRDDLSADYFGAFARKFSGVAILSNGSSGDINNNNYGGGRPPRRKPYEQIERVAEAVARAARGAMENVTYHDRVPLAMAEEEIELSVRQPAVEDIERAKKILDAAKGRALRGRPEIYARETLLLSDYPSTVRLKLQALRIGDLGIVAIPCEVFVEIGLEIKRRSPLKPTFMIELANGYNGYLPTPEHHQLGGYETWRARSSYLEANASRMITGNLLNLLRHVAR